MLRNSIKVLSLETTIGICHAKRGEGFGDRLLPNPFLFCAVCIFVYI